MPTRSVLRSTVRWFRRAVRWFRHALERRKARLAAIRRPDERLVELSQQQRDQGQPYRTWRRTLPDYRRGGGFG